MEQNLLLDLIEDTLGNINTPVNGIDRLDSSKPYEVDNCVSCCSKCNYMKQDNTEQEFIDQIKKIYNNLIRQGSQTISQESTLQANGNGNGDPLNDEDIVESA